MNWSQLAAIAALIALAIAIVGALEARQQWAFEQWRIEHERLHHGIWCAINPETCYGRR